MSHPVINGEFRPGLATSQVIDLLVTALEGGSNYWYYDLDADLPDGICYADIQQGGKFTGDEYYHPMQLMPFVDGCAITLKDSEGDDTDKAYRIDRAALQNGLDLLTLTPLWSEFVNDYYDAITADVFLQLVCFGEVIYG